MINIDYIMTEDNFLIKLEGHAGYDKPGKDIVCAAVSSLFQSLRDHVIHLHSEKAFEQLTTWEKAGAAYLCVGNFNNAMDKYAIKQLFEMVINAYINLSHDYPNNIKLVPYREKI